MERIRFTRAGFRQDEHHCVLVAGSAALFAGGAAGCAGGAGGVAARRLGSTRTG
jgi:hypothetical protein